MPVDSLTIFGTLTVGAVSSFAVEFLKKFSWFPQNAIAYRAATAILCLVLFVGYTLSTGGTVDVSTVLETFLAYLTATAAYVHVKQ